MSDFPVAQFHYVERTSIKGEGMPFVGKCILCGKENLPASAALEKCTNPRGLTVDKAMIEILNGETDDTTKQIY